jgi:hypothetical protein
MTEPTTEAGRRLADDPDNLPHGLLVTRILAIEAEARADCAEKYDALFANATTVDAIRADALREAAERVRAYKEKFGLPTDPHDLFAAVLAILAAEETPSTS